MLLLSTQAGLTEAGAHYVSWLSPSPRRVMTMTDAGLGNRIKVSRSKYVVGKDARGTVWRARRSAWAFRSCLLTYSLTHLLTYYSLTYSPDQGDRARVRPACSG